MRRLARMRPTWAPHGASEAGIACFAAAMDGMDKDWGAGMGCSWDCWLNCVQTNFGIGSFGKARMIRGNMIATRESLKNPCRDSGIHGQPLISRSSKRFK